MQVSRSSDTSQDRYVRTPEYVANRVGGVHFDVTRDRLGPEVEAQFVAMDRAMETFNVADKRCVYFELLAIGQILVASPDVAELLEP